MSERSEYAAGEFCWVELAVPDVDAAASFYGELLGWDRERYEPDHEGYWYLRTGGKLVAGLERVRQEGQAPGWLSYISVDDLPGVADTVRAAGGDVLAGPLEVPGGAGSLAVCRDVEGAVFGVWQAGELEGAELVNELGAWSWSNLMTRDLEGAKDFYGKVFGWTAEHNEEAPPNILNWQVEGQRWPEGLGGVMGITDDLPADMPPHWQVYFIVENADGAIEQAESSGAKVGFGPIDIPMARLATLVDPQGAVVSIMEWHFPDPR